MGKLDIVLKHALTAFPGDWARFLGVRPGVGVDAVDVDLSTVSQMADKLLRVHDTPEYLLHIEPQSYYDAELDARMLQYQATARRREKMDVYSVALILHSGAWRGQNTGWVRSRIPFPGCRIEFEYRVIKVWELPVESILTAGIGLLPLAPLADVTVEELPEVVEAMSQRLVTEVPPAEAGELWAAADILMGLKYSSELTDLMLQKARAIMHESVTYQRIIREGERKGMQSAILKLGVTRFGTASEETVARIRAVQDAEQLDKLFEKAFTASSWDEVLEACDVPSA